MPKLLPLLTLSVSLASVSVSAATLRITAFDDINEVESGVNAELGDTDFAGFDMVFDNSTGAYEIKVFADSAKPFHDNVRLNINMYNETVSGTYISGTSILFSDNLNDLNLANSTTQLTLTGQNSLLTSWNEGDSILLAQSSPGFASGIYDNVGEGVPLTGDSLPITTPLYTTVSAVPIPAAAWLFGSALLGLAGIKRRRA